MPPLADHRVTLKPVWAPDKHTSDLLGTKARRIVGWTATCTRCAWSIESVTWSDARLFGRNHRKSASRVTRG